MDILLIHPSKKILGRNDSLYTNESLTPSLGLGTIASYCRGRGIDIKIIDLRLPGMSINNVLECVKRERPIIGITAFTNEITSAGQIARFIKDIQPDSFIVIGGPHSSLVPLETLKEFSAFDVAVIGEGEETIVELFYHMRSGSKTLQVIEGIAYPCGEDFVLNPKRAPLSNLNDLPYPAWDLFEIDRYSGPFMVSIARGCPYTCYFCTPNYLGKVRTRDPIRIVDEIEYSVEKFMAKQFQFADATLSLLESRIFVLCDEIIKRELHTKIQWDCETRADKINLELLYKMREAGCRWVSLGVETGSDRILRDVIRKGETKEDIVKAVKLIKEAGLKIRCFFILGHYTETVDTIEETIQFALALNPEALSFGLIVPNPGSELRSLAEKNKGGLRILHNSWEDYDQFNYDCFESESLPLKELKRWQSKAYLTFYLYHPLKGLKLFTDRSGYNYNYKAFLKAPLMLLHNLLRRN